MKNNNNNDTLTIAVIGAGPCGIAMAKNLLQQGLKQVVVFEKNNAIGGNWIFDENNHHASVYETTHIISSKRLSEYEDFPMPKEYPDYPSHAQLLKYFNDYVHHFGILPYIRFNTTVIHATQTSSKQWQITYQDNEGIHTTIFDALCVANGHHWDPLMPEDPGQFSGQILHAHQYKKAQPFKDQRVLVVGGGNSACDIAVEVARVAQKTCISMRSGQHIFPKFIFGKPTDVAFKKISWMPRYFKSRLVGAVIRTVQGRYAKYQLKKPSTKPLDVHPTINSELLYFIRHGKIHPRDGIFHMDEHCIHFNNGHEEEFDTIIFATGYKISFPFFDQDWVNDKIEKNLNLYRKMLHPEMDNLYFIGLFQPQGCIWPLADYQAKIATCIINGTLKRPLNLSQKIQQEIKARRNHFTSSPRHALEVDYHQFRKQLLAELK